MGGRGPKRLSPKIYRYGAYQNDTVWLPLALKHYEWRGSHINRIDAL